VLFWMDTKLVTCSCNGTVVFDPETLQRSLGDAGVSVTSVLHGAQLCRRELPRVAEQLEGTADVIVGCTQEAKLFSEVAAARKTVAPLRFVNLREQAGWGREGRSATPKIAALVAMATGASMDPVPAVGYRSAGRVLLVGGGDALRWGERLAATMAVTVLLDSRASALPTERLFPVVSGRLSSLRGWLGAFDASWQQSNPIDLEACVRCGACVAACPEQAIGADFQVDMDRCRSHRRCVDACIGIGAIDFERVDPARTGQFDLVIDCRERPAFDSHQLPQGYFHPGADVDAQADAVLQASRLVGEFDKPKFFKYREKLCAHSRNEITGCRQCIDVCSAEAIRSDGDRIAVEPHLCVGCGACATVCPSGAMSYAYPAPGFLGGKVRSGLSAWRAAGGQGAAPMVLFHDLEAGTRVLDGLGRGAGPAVARGAAAPAIVGLPARVIPVALHHVASVGIDLALSAIAFGAGQVAVLATGREAPQYLDALRREFATAQTLVTALGYTGVHFHVIEAGDAGALETVLRRIEPAQTISRAATFALSEDKRRSVEFAVDHLAAEAIRAGGPTVKSIPLAAGAPFGTSHIDKVACTLCLACTGACPESALLDNPERPQLRFIERNCVQCGLCEKTCPENAIRLEPRYTLDKETLATRVLNEADPFNCVGCGKAFGTRQMVENMMGKLAGHGMFAGTALKRLQMCADCRVVDMIKNQSETSILDVTPGQRPQ
jgi:ferredoxin